MSSIKVKKWKQNTRAHSLPKENNNDKDNDDVDEA
jgi:hypothetical protein